MDKFDELRHVTSISKTRNCKQASARRASQAALKDVSTNGFCSQCRGMPQESAEFLRPGADIVIPYLLSSESTIDCYLVHAGISRFKFGHIKL